MIMKLKIIYIIYYALNLFGRFNNFKQVNIIVQQYNAEFYRHLIKYIMKKI